MISAVIAFTLMPRYRRFVTRVWPPCHTAAGDLREALYLRADDARDDGRRRLFTLLIFITRDDYDAAPPFQYSR